MRTRLPSWRTLPSSTVRTLSFRAISAILACLPLKENDEVRAATRRLEVLARSLRISSESPSPRYSFAGSPLMLTNGITATDSGGGAVANFVDANGTLALRHHIQ